MSEKHRKLIELATTWLEENNYNDIEFEVKVPNPTGKKYSNSDTTPRKAYFALDVIGRNKNKKIVIECGGSKATKLNALLGLFNEVWVLPYGATIPYCWDREKDICQSYGHII